MAPIIAQWARQSAWLNQANIAPHTVVSHGMSTGVEISLTGIGGTL